MDNQPTPYAPQMASWGVAPAPSVDNLGGMLQPNGGVNLDFSNGVLDGSAPANAGAGAAAPGFFSLDSFLGKTHADGSRTSGWGSAALGTFSGLANTWLGMQQYGLAKDALKENKRQFNINHKNQVKMVNSQLEDRQRARVASNAGAYQSVGSYMDKNGVS